MWIIFEYQHKFISLEWSGDETFEDIKRILMEVYHITGVAFSSRRPQFQVTQKDYGKKVRDIFESYQVANQDYVEMLLTNLPNAKPSTPFGEPKPCTKQANGIVIGDTEVLIETRINARTVSQLSSPPM